jgi:hypothetical protein
MRFDAARALGTFQELGDPRFAGPDAWAQLADFVAERFAKSGYHVVRREVVGSRFPQRAAPWIGWAGYGALLTASFLLVRLDTILPSFLALMLSWLIMPWVVAIVRNRIHLGRRRPPLEKAPVVIASLPSDPPAPAVRVVFQALLAGLKSDLGLWLTRSGEAAIVLLMIGPFLINLVISSCQTGFFLDPNRRGLLVVPGILTRYAYPGLLAVWIALLGLLSREHHLARRREGLYPIDKRGLAVLIEMARTWRRAGSRPFEPVFVAAGGQQLDHAGSREIVRLLESEWPPKPTLIVLFFAPGAGEVLRMSDGMYAEPQIATEAAKSLWIPVFRLDPWAVCPFWPFDRQCSAQRIEYLALIGSDPRAFFDTTASGQMLSSAAQLATEIALRWAKKQPPSPLPDSTT